jgi:hypothetical protein
VRVHHTITFLDNQLTAKRAASLRAQLELRGLVKRGNSLLNFTILEDQTLWPEVAAILLEYPALDLTWTEFSPAELRVAQWVELRATSHHGYPMPDEDFGYLAATFDLREYCSACGVGAVQNAPFRLRSEPRWGRRRVLQLNWAFDVFFVDAVLYQSAFAPLGVRARPVLHHRSGKVLPTVVQLVPDHDEMVLALTDAPTETCESCGRVKHLPLGRRQHHIQHTLPGQFVRSHQVFGSGASAHRLVVASNALYQAILHSGTRGLSYGVVSV